MFNSNFYQRRQRNRLTHPLVGRPSVSVGLQPSGIGNIITLYVFKDAPHRNWGIFSWKTQRPPRPPKKSQMQCSTSKNYAASDSTFKFWCTITRLRALVCKLIHHAHGSSEKEKKMHTQLKVLTYVWTCYIDAWLKIYLKPILLLRMRWRA